MIKAAVFDLDHTLFDRYGTIRKIAPDIVALFDINEGITAETFAEKLSFADKQYVHKGWQKIYEHLVAENIFKTVPTFEEYSQNVLKCFRKATVKYDFAIPTLKKLQMSGIKTGLITNGTPELQYFKIKSLELEECFDEIIVSGETPYEKPDTRIFQLMAQKLGVETQEMMYIGDHPLNDVDGAAQAGCIPVWVKTTGTWIFPGIKKPELQIETVEEIPGIVERINSL